MIKLAADFIARGLCSNICKIGIARNRLINQINSTVSALSPLNSTLINKLLFSFPICRCRFAIQAFEYLPKTISRKPMIGCALEMQNNALFQALDRWLLQFGTSARSSRRFKLNWIAVCSNEGS